MLAVPVFVAVVEDEPEGMQGDEGAGERPMMDPAPVAESKVSTFDNSVAITADVNPRL